MTRDSAPLIMLVITIYPVFEHRLCPGAQGRRAPTLPVFKKQTMWHPLLVDAAQEGTSLWVGKSKKMPLPLDCGSV